MFFTIFLFVTSSALYLKRNYLTYLINLNLQYSNSTAMNITTPANCLNITENAVFIKDECACIFRDPVDPDCYVNK
jgi:hypothetical protein